MNQLKSLQEFGQRLCARLRALAPGASSWAGAPFAQKPQRSNSLRAPLDFSPAEFNESALELFRLQFEANRAFQKICESRGLSPHRVDHWTQIPAVPAAAFKEWELSCIPEGQRTGVFFSSGTTEHRPSRHFHNLHSLEVYEASVLAWFRAHLCSQQSPSATTKIDGVATVERVLALTPPPQQAPCSSLVHMFETLRQNVDFSGFEFVGYAEEPGAWLLDLNRALVWLREASAEQNPVMLLGTAFSYVHLLDYLAQANLSLVLPPGSRALETGGYKGRSRELPQAELHSLISCRLGIPASHIVCEYGMSELSSQAYDRPAAPAASPRRLFRFPPWAKAQIISPETGQEVREGTAGLMRVFDLANVFSVMGVQTEDLAVSRGDGFELLGRAALAEARGCSLMAV